MARQRELLRGTALGFVATMIVAVLFSTGVLDPLESYALDKRQIYCNRLDVDDRIIHVDIDDGSLEAVGRWPWDRDRVADLIRVISAARPLGIALDFIYQESQRARADVEMLDRDPGGLEGPIPKTLPPGRWTVINPDAELNRAIRDAGVVIMAVQGRFDAGRAANHMGDYAASSPDRDARREARTTLKQLLLRQFDVPPDALAEQWEATTRDLADRLDGLELDHILAGVKQEAADTLVRRLANTRSDLSRLNDVISGLGLDPLRLSPADRGALKRALQKALAYRAFIIKTLPVPRLLDQAPEVMRVPNIELPYYVFAEAVSGYGFVAVDKDDRAAYGRRLPLLMNVGGRLVPHLGFAAAAQVLGLDLNRVGIEAGRRVRVTSVFGAVYHVPTDEHGRVFIHWSPSDQNWARHTRHLAAGRFMQVAGELDAIDKNIRLRRDDLKSLAEILHPPVVINARRQQSETGAALLATIDAWSVAAPAAIRRRLFDAPTTDEEKARLAALDDEIAAFIRQAEGLIQEELDSYREAPPEDQQEEARLAQLGNLLDRDGDIDFARELAAVQSINERMYARAAAVMADLRARVEGRYVFVGFTATAQGDFVPTAVDRALPGVIAHASVLNMFLKNRFIKFPSRSTEMMLVLLFGVTATLIAANRTIIGTAVAISSMLVGYAIINGFVLFRLLDLKVDLVGPMLATAGASVPLAFYRWWTSDRQRREIRAQFGQYTSPALANKIADDPAAVALLTRVETRDVTCFFSDLKGFTTIAEQTDPAHTRAVLNVYLDRMSEVLDGHQALINKFMGDGIFAFFNSSVLPRPDHPREACEAALDCLAALKQLREQSGDGDLHELIQKFEMRVGLASGTAGVGDFGSSRKKDYTVIGDVANLAARLEPANKVFGTELLISGATRDAVADEYEFRYLAELQVKGKQLTVPVFELMGRKGAVSDEDKAWAERFAAGVELYKRRKWDECIMHFTRMLGRRFDDLGASTYIGACEEKKAFPPDDDWAGALQLKEK
ncbi:MAG: CHASE2 domain-containing protein [Phycisphaerae bacterium]